MKPIRLALLNALGSALLLAGCGSPPVNDSSCDPVCPDGQVCIQGVCHGLDAAAGPDLRVAPDLSPPPGCQPPCAAPTPYCNPSRECVPCLDDSHCPPGTVCKAFGAFPACVPGCSDDSRCGGAGGPDGGAGAMKCCGGQCLDTSSDSVNCGACGASCALPHSSATCAGGQCVLGRCSSGWGDCNLDKKDGCETNLRVDPANCGACGSACAFANAVAACADACYLAACQYGFADCNGDAPNGPHDGCETSVLADPKNCGACGTLCGPVAHGKNGCDNGACRVSSCDAGFADCDGVTNNGCETNVNIDAKNCGKCGNACGQNLICNNGGCTCQNCFLANAKSACVNLQCIINSCLPGFADCDGIAKNGCESATDSDANNCGGCFIACGGKTPFCQGGVCSQVGVSCAAILKSNPKSPDGVYLVDPDGVGGIPPTQVFCDMTTDGGGWLVCYNHNIVNVEEMDQSTVAHMGTIYGSPGAQNEFGTDCRSFGHAMQPTAVRFTAADNQHWVQANNPPDSFHEFFFAGNKGAGGMVTVTTWSGGNKTWNRAYCVHDCPIFAWNTNNINQIATGTNSGNCFEHNSKSADSNHHWAMWGNCDGTYVEGPNQGAGGAQPDAPRSGWARVMLR
jgi:hypothetical protein